MQEQNAKRQRNGKSDGPNLASSKRSQQKENSPNNPKQPQCQRATVALVRCESYEDQAVYNAVQKGLELLGGIGKFIAVQSDKPGIGSRNEYEVAGADRKKTRVLLKPNLLFGDPPQRCTTTHPAVLKAVGKICLEHGADVSYGDSPGGGGIGLAVRGAGYTLVAEEAGLQLADYKNGVEVLFPEGRKQKKFMLAKGVVEADAIISLPKMKTHGFMRITGAVKNQFGCIVGVRKAGYHMRYSNAADFAQMLLDLNACVNPRLYIMDGIKAMEGNGPRGGVPKPMNCLMFATDPIAMDATFARLVDLDPHIALTNKLGDLFGFGTSNQDNIELVGDPFDSFFASDFDVVRTPIRVYKQGLFANVRNKILLPKPVIQPEKCIRCGLCVRSCPAQPKALYFPVGPTSIAEKEGQDKKREPPVPCYNYKHCIRCFCCQEMCPESAIELQKPLKLFLRGTM